jgi:hypothetical protein
VKRVSFATPSYSRSTLNLKKTMIPDNNTQLDWGLDEPLRFPVTASSWSPQLTIPNVDLLDIQPSGAHFASVIKPRKPRETYATLAKLIDAFPEDFELAAAAITPAGWRQLYYRGTYVLECLSSPRFHPDQELRRICELPEHFDDAPPEWLGTTDLLQDLASDTCYSIRQIGAGAGPGCLGGAFSSTGDPAFQE